MRESKQYKQRISGMLGSVIFYFKFIFNYKQNTNLLHYLQVLYWPFVGLKLRYVHPRQRQQFRNEKTHIVAGFNGNFIINNWPRHFV